MARPRSVFMAVVASVVLVLSVASCGDGDDGDDGDSDRAATAAELIDTFLQAWNEDDPDLVPSVFTEDGLYLSFQGSTLEGREQISNYLRQRSGFVENMVRVGNASEGDDGTYAMVIEFDLGGEPLRGTAAVELDGGLASRIFWVEDPVPVE